MKANASERSVEMRKSITTPLKHLEKRKGNRCDSSTAISEPNLFEPRGHALIKNHRHTIWIAIVARGLSHFLINNIDKAPKEKLNIPTVTIPL